MYILFNLLHMNNKQAKIAATTAVSTLGAEALIGGLGVGLLGTAVAVPASLVVATVGTLAFFAAGDDAPKSVSTPPSPNTGMTVYFLKKGMQTYKFSVNQSRGWGQTCWNLFHHGRYNDYKYYSTLDELRDFYKSLLANGWKPA